MASGGLGWVPPGRLQISRDAKKGEDSRTLVQVERGVGTGERLQDISGSNLVTASWSRQLSPLPEMQKGTRETSASAVLLDESFWLKEHPPPTLETGLGSGLEKAMAGKGHAPGCCACLTPYQEHRVNPAQLKGHLVDNRDGQIRFGHPEAFLWVEQGCDSPADSAPTVPPDLLMELPCEESTPSHPARQQVGDAAVSPQTVLFSSSSLWSRHLHEISVWLGSEGAGPQFSSVKELIPGFCPGKRKTLPISVCESVEIVSAEPQP
ncbi:hypothetical protein JEQ12_013297 [Ovis aries]|uniref:Uncharacterized protein n=1 Tax=Ovis aries TaxID=9940 RepID=A0A836CPW0_SHEEP|nr:hypothetical protein JEQ12_013297 [Ovis aries]